jgi:hypothetical protein
MKIITIRQPWAHLIVNGSKNIENWTWATSYRGPVLIHASLNVNRALCLKHRLDLKTLKRGGVIGIAEIADCVNMHPSRWFIGPYGFVLRKRRPLPFIKWKGALGLREVPSRLRRRISPGVLRKYLKKYRPLAAGSFFHLSSKFQGLTPRCPTTVRYPPYHLRGAKPKLFPLYMIFSSLGISTLWPLRY